MCTTEPVANGSNMFFFTRVFCQSSGGSAAKPGAFSLIRITDWSRGSRIQMLVRLVLGRGAFPKRRVGHLLLCRFSLAFGKQADQLRRGTIHGVIAAPVYSSSGTGLLYDALFDDRACAAFLSFLERGEATPSRNGSIRGSKGSSALDELRGPGERRPWPFAARLRGTEQYVAVLYDDRLILWKLPRRQQEGLNPDCEIGRYLTEAGALRWRAPFAGMIEYASAPTEPLDARDAAGVRGESRGWMDLGPRRAIALLRELRHRRVAPRCHPGGAGSACAVLMELAKQEPSRLARDHVGIALDSATKLGNAYGRSLHSELAGGVQRTSGLRAPEPLTKRPMLQNDAGLAFARKRAGFWIC